MYISRNEEEATWILIATDDTEARVLREIAERIKPEECISYGGRTTDETGAQILYLHAGAETVWMIETRKNGGTYEELIHIGGVVLFLGGTREEDKEELQHVRDTCYVGGGGGLTYVSSLEVEGQPAIVTTGRRCKNCGKGILNAHLCWRQLCQVHATKSARPTRLLTQISE